MGDNIHWTSTVYVLAALDDGGNHTLPCKIGVANNPSSRLTTIQTACPFKIELFMWIRSPTRELAMLVEQAAHETFSDRRAFGEWFNLPPVDAAIGVMSLMKDAIDCLSLPDATVNSFLDKSGMTKIMRLLLDNRRQL